MDPVTAAGLAVSITSLALQVFAGCVRGYRIFVEMENMPKRFEHLRTRLRIEQTRLLNWGENIGLVEELLENPSQALKLNQNLILDILVQVQAAFKTCIKVESKFSDVKGGKASTPSPLNSQQKRSFLWRTLAVLESPTRIATSLQWAMIKGDAFEDSIVKLISYNDAMWSLLDRHTMSDLHVMQTQSNLIMLQLADQVSELRNITAAMAIRPTALETYSTFSLSQSGTILERSSAQHSGLAGLAAFKAQQLSIEKSDAPSTELLISSVGLKQPFQKSEAPALFNFNGSRVWVEWREPVQEDLTQPLLQKMEERVRKLAALLSQPENPKEFRSPHCLGYLCETDDAGEPRYGFVFKVPDEEGPDSSSKRLNNLREQYLTTPCPSLTKRMELALMIVESLFYLHAVNWLHKGLRSKNILFFTEAKQESTDLSSLVVSGFDFSRPDLPEEITVRHNSNIFEELYQHPDRIRDTGTNRPRSQKWHDIYSLGIILLEIAFWQPIEIAMGIATEQKNARATVRKIRDRILDKDQRSALGELSTMTRLKSQVGDVYAEVVRRCVLGGEAMGADPNPERNATWTNVEIEVQTQQIFFDGILTRLHELKL